MKKSTAKKNNQFVFLAFLIFNFLVFLSFWLASKYLCPTSQFQYADSGQKPVWLWSRANFDGVHYLSIAQNGYGLYQQAFFPLYPKLIRFLAKILGGQYLLGGFLISFFSFWAALAVFYKLIRLDWPEKTAKSTIINLIIFPTSFFFAAVYAESLFLFLILLAFWWARKGKWGLAPLAAGLASATKFLGIFLLPALLFELWRQKEKGQKLKLGFSILTAWVVLVSSAGLLAYMGYLNKHFGDPLMFIHLQPHFGAQRTGGKIILLYQVFWRYFKMIATSQKNTPLYFTVWLEFLSAVLFLGLLIYGYLRKINWSYLIFAALAFITPTLTGTCSSLPRYVLVLFPGFIALSLLQEKYRLAGKVFMVFSVILLLASQFLFSQGYWIG
jgi:Gpi18-like mannosyltransferase